MKRMKAISSIIFVVFIIYMSGRCYGQQDSDSEEEPDLSPMEKTEKEALFSTIQGFVGNSWNGSNLFPDPCGWSPIQVPFYHTPNYTTFIYCAIETLETSIFIFILALWSYFFLLSFTRNIYNIYYLIFWLFIIGSLG